jgi:hypothetical protein
MSARHIGWVGPAVVLALVAALAPAADEDDPKAKQRLEVMQTAMDALEVKSDGLKPKALAAATKPLLRYSDPTRGPSALVDAGVWRLGAEGRPTALVTVEFYRRANGSQVLSFEFLSLTAKTFALKHTKEAVRWDATESGLELKALPDAPKPDATPAKRLTQMRQLARRFAATETYNDETVECRLIAQPIDRYQSEKDKITDGAIFALANGTNPEIGIVLECDADRWVYGVLRLCGAKSTVTLDGKQVAAYEKFTAGARPEGAYVNGERIELGKESP